MLDRFLDFVKINSLFDKEEKLLLAFSGGADSVALFHLLRKGDFNFFVAHVNYSLRVDESDEDELFVKKLCEKYKVECFIKKIESTYWDKKVKIQDEARKIRYAFFDTLLEEYNFSKILTAHHKDDNVETILMNITRGTGLKGLKGISMKQDHLIRPLLFAERAQIESFLMHDDQKWREDSSNSSNKYKRNRFRNEIIPLLKAENPSFSEAIDRLIENITEADELFQVSYKEFYKDFVKIDGDQLIINKSRPDRLHFFLFELLNKYGFNREQVKDLLNSLNDIGNSFHSNSHIIYVDRVNLILIEDAIEDDEEVKIFENTSTILQPIKLKFQISIQLISSKDNKIGQFDLNKIIFPLRLRNWKEGDRIRPLGMKGSKKISDVLIDNKISMADKRTIKVLVSNHEIIWIPGIMISENVKVDNKTNKIWKAELQ